MRNRPQLSKIITDLDAAPYESTSRILKRLPGIPHQQGNHEDPGQSVGLPDLDKSTLRLTAHKGAFLKPCPGTKGYICCGYQILHIGTNCPLNCSYCILQGYFTESSIRIFVNLERELACIGRTIDNRPEKIFRIGTGEFTDSLSLDPVAGWSDLLLPFFSIRKNTVLEMKTKTNHIGGLLSSRHRDGIIVSWSLNSPYISSKEEKGAPSIRKRLEAAKRCQDEGYILGFHFDPLIAHPKWKEGYMRVVEMLDRYIAPERVIWISLGCLRYMPALKDIVRRRHPGTHILDGEFIRGLDKKMRYFKPIRLELYSFMADILAQWHKDRAFYLCMETDEIWSKSLGWSPGDTEGLSRYLDARVRKVFGYQQQGAGAG
jgi:spore photoproduct lyase